MQHSGYISDSTPIERHLHYLLLDLSGPSWISLSQDKSALRTIRVLAAITLLAYWRLSVFSHFCAVTMRTFNRYPNSYKT